MKKLLLTTAVAALAATPALANDGVKLSLGGVAKVYLGYTDQDETVTEDYTEFDIYRESEVHFTGETTLDNGLTVGAHFEMEMNQDEDANVEESYIYMSGDWGRVNIGSEDGAAFLLQVAAPSADANVDGIRVTIGATSKSVLDYDHDQTGYNEKITYLSPVFSGFQAGLTFTPSVTTSVNNGSNGHESTDTSYEVAGRYEGAFEEVGFVVGAGYSEVDELDAWNTGLDLDFGPFGLGVSYMEEETSTTAETETLVVGADYTVGAYKLGASYFNQDDDTTESDRYTAGVSYKYGPGMSFRGSVSYLEQDATSDFEATSVLVGTQINF